MGKMKSSSGTPAMPPQPDFGKMTSNVGMGPQGNMFGTSAKNAQGVISKSEAATLANNPTMVKNDLTKPCD